MPQPYTGLLSQEPAFSREETLAEALSIAEIIAGHAQTICGRTNWLTCAYDPNLQRRRLQPMSFRLYDGICGTSLFLAVAGKYFGLPHLHELAAKALEGITSVLKANPRELFQYGLGAATGAFSVVYALSNAARPLARPEFLDDAQALAASLIEEDIAAGNSLDLLSGTAGCLLCLLRLYKMRPEAGTLDMAIRCGEHLLAQRAHSPSGFRAWATVHGTLRTGLAHGAAGIGYALVELYGATGDQKFLAAATEAREFENSLYSQQSCNWLAGPSMPPSHNRWCNGAVGIGLSRLGALSIISDQAYVDDTRLALEVANRASETMLDYPCCGNLGLMELFLSASHRPEFAYARVHAELRAAAVIHKARLRGHYGLEPNEGIYNCSLHQGMAGIGYQLLRLSIPEQVPSMLLWN